MESQMETPINTNEYNYLGSIILWDRLGSQDARSRRRPGREFVLWARVE